jgi:hypothetical protein
METLAADALVFREAADQALALTAVTVIKAVTVRADL